MKRVVLTVHHIDGDCGNFIIGNSFDEYELRSNDTPLFNVRFEYENERESVRLTGLADNFYAQNLPGVKNQWDLVGKLVERFQELMEEREVEFYCDLMTDDDGNERRVELVLEG